MTESETMDSLHDIFSEPSTKEKPIRHFVIVKPDGTESGSYTGRTPRQAALKAIKEVAATDGKPSTLGIRERGTNKVHVFIGHISMENAPENAPAWLKKGLIKVAHVAKVGIEKVDKIGPELVKSGVLTSEDVAKINALPLPGQKVN